MRSSLQWKTLNERHLFIGVFCIEIETFVGFVVRVIIASQRAKRSGIDFINLLCTKRTVLEEQSKSQNQAWQHLALTACLKFQLFWRL